MWLLLWGQMQKPHFSRKNKLWDQMSNNLWIANCLNTLNLHQCDKTKMVSKNVVVAYSDFFLSATRVLAKGFQIIFSIWYVTLSQPCSVNIFFEVPIHCGCNFWLTLTAFQVRGALIPMNATFPLMAALRTIATHGFTEAHLQENESHYFNSQC